jgi:hypothetical protein
MKMGGKEKGATKGRANSKKIGLTNLSSHPQRSASTGVLTTGVTPEALSKSGLTT